MSRIRVFTPQAWDDYQYWLETDKAMVKRINRLFTEAIRDPFAGAGKPEPLRHLAPNTWSRRSDQEHRMVYQANAQQVVLLMLRYHYG